MNDDRYIVGQLVVQSYSPGALSSREKKIEKDFALDKAHFGAF